MTHSLYSEENKRRGEPDARRLIAEFPTREAALLAARLRLDEDLQELYRDGISAEELVRLWTLFGDEPSLAPDDATAPFSAIDYVRSRAADLTENRGRLHAGSPNADEASDEAGDEPDDNDRDDAPLTAAERAAAEKRRAGATRAVELFIKLIGGLTSLGFVIGGAVLLQTALQIWSSQRGAHEWIETPGVVQRARAEKHDVGLGDPDDPHSRSKIYLVRIEFAATLDGRPVKQFADAPRQTPPDRNTRYEAEQAAATYKRGDPVTVYYLPGDPTTARLVPPPGSSLGTVALSGGLGLAALAIGLVGAWYMLFQFERRSPDENATAG